MKDLMYEYAVYTDDEGKRNKIFAVDLKELATYEKANQLNLLDPSEQFQVIARKEAEGKDGRRAHFAALGDPSCRQVFKGENDPVHNRRVETLLEQLHSAEHFLIESVSYINRQHVLNSLGKLYGYKWKAEVHRIVSADTVVRHDLFGQSPEIEMSIHRPWVAIEVIHTHFPDESAFQGMINISRAMPLLVLFDCTAAPDYFLKITPQSNKLDTKLYMLNGNFYLENRKLDITTSQGLRVEVHAAINKRLEIEEWKKTKGRGGGSK